MLRLLSGFLLLAACGRAAIPRAPTSSWMTVATGKLARVSVERAVYDAGDPARFYIHVRVENTSSAPLAVDLRDYWNIVYPNQWERSPIDHREVVDEARMTPRRFDAAALRADASAGKLTPIAPGASVDVYRDFNAGGRASVDAQPGRWLLIALDGHVLVTNDTDVEDLRVADDDPRRILAVDAAPIAWQTVPAGARMLADR